jgi:ADP-heptose:LPS heptosyltransferase
MDLSTFKKPYLFSENGGIGDAYIQLPLLRALNHIFNNKITLITSEFNKNLYMAEGFSEILTFPLDFVRTPEYSTFKYDLKALSDLLVDADFFIDSNTWHLKEGGYEDFIRTRQFPTLGFYDFFKEHTYADFSLNSFDLSFNLAKKISENIKIEDFAYPPVLSKTISDFMAEVKSKFTKDIIILGIQDQTKEDKMWPQGNFESLINDILGKYSNVAILIFGDKSLIDKSCIHDRSRVLDFEVTFDFQVMNGFMSIIDFFIGIDSVFLHLADLHRIPSLGLFGPTNHKEWGFRFTNGIELVAKNGKMSSISIEEVLKAFSILTETETASN